MNKIKYTTALLLGGLLSFSSCTDNFADFNSTEGAYTDELQKYDNQTNLVILLHHSRASSNANGCGRHRLAIPNRTEPGGHVLWISHERRASFNAVNPIAV